MIQILSAIISAILIGLLTTPRATTLSKVILHSSISFNLLLLLFTHIAGYIDLFYQCGIKQTLTVSSLILLSGSTLLFSIKKGWRKKIQLPALDLRSKEWIIYIPILFLYLILITANLLFFPDSYDGNAYHLPLAIKFLQNNSFSQIPRIWQYAMPANAESVFTFFSLAGNSILLNFSQSVLLIGLVFWSYQFNKMYFGFSNTSARICTVLLLSMPVIFQGTFFHYIDFFGTTFLYFSITSALLIQKIQKKKFFTPLFFSCLFYGIALGTKLTFIVFSPILSALILYALYARRKEISFGYVLKTITICSVAFILLSSFWYLRNYVLFSNSLFPLDVPLLRLPGIPIESIVSKDYEVRFTGGSTIGWLLFPFTEQHPTGEYYFSFGPLFGVFILPAFTIATLHSFFRSIKKETNVLLLFNIMCILTITLWFLFLSRQPRFIMIAPVLMITSAGYVYDRICTRKHLSYVIILAFSSLLLLLYPVTYLSRIAFCLYYQYSPHYWDAYYKLPITSCELEKRDVLNLNEETMNFALYGPAFKNRVVTTQDVQNTIYGAKLSYLARQNLPSYSDEQIEILFRKYGNCLFYSKEKLNNKNLRLISRSVDRFPRIQWLNSCIYEYAKTNQN